MFKQVITAIKAYGRAVKLISEHKLWLYFLYPVLICILLYIGGMILLYQAGSLVQEWVVSHFPTKDNSSAFMSFLSGTLEFIIAIGIKIIFFFAYSSIIRNLILIVLSPVLALLSERIEEIETGKKFPFNLWQFIKDIMRGSLLALRNMVLQLLLIFACFLLMLIPVAGWVGPILLPLINFYFYGFSMMDYASEREKMGIRESVRFVRKNKGLAIGNGFVFTLIFAIPYAGVVIAPIVGVVAGTLVSIEAREKNKLYGKN